LDLDAFNEIVKLWLFTQECCYIWRGRLIMSGKWAGFYHTVVRKNSTLPQYLKENVVPWKYCCKDSTTFCSKFYEKRPNQLI